MPDRERKYYADVILPLAVKGLLTYEVPPEFTASVFPGSAVRVPLGQERTYVAIVRRVHTVRPDIQNIRSIAELISNEPLAGELQMDFWDWVAGYYMCPAGEVMRAAMPAPLIRQIEAGTSGRKRKKPGIANVNHSDDSVVEPALNELTELQKTAYENILSSFSTHDVALLHGVTSSGKTEIYFHLIREQLNRGKQVLYMVPEIVLTAQLIGRIEKSFGGKAIVYHSRITDRQRVEVWRQVRGMEPGTRARLVLGVRSSLFLPFSDLGLVVIDEEHDVSYKQQDPAPRYNARDAAIVLAGKHKARVVLGSATPSLESFHNAMTGKYGFAELMSRHGETDLPEITIADTRRAAKRKEMVSHFTPQLMEAIDEALAAGEQVILFRNRRGFAPFVQCASCGWIPACGNCSVSLTYHRTPGRLKCHYCGFYGPLPSSCEKCGSTKIATVGFGTEKIEEELRIVFPEARVARLDQDTTKGLGGARKILEEFGSHSTDILIGTQMISKGLDFENLTVVGILHADSLLNYPDFRSCEKSFQMMEQVSGRSGRRKKRGRVIIQTGDPGNEIIGMVLSHDFRAMYESQLAERELFGYPPFSRLIRIYLKHRDRSLLDEYAEAFAADLKRHFGKRVMGPEYPPVSRIQSMYVKSLLVKIERNRSQARAKDIISGAVERLLSSPGIGSLRVNIDVDPL
ncbi:MAG: primosomal protein N' [Bacteroidales bacterium]|jgi:primosomal protein N' (replication factor Y)|nr:primosomal protein N' [Bacteroidales bacterium]